MSGAAVGTIVAKNFLSFARVLAWSLREHHPELPMFVVLADQPEGMFDPVVEPFEIIPLDTLGIPELRRVCFRYTRQQVSIAAKPYLLRHLLDRGFTSAVFLDADILVMGRLEPLLAATAGHAIALTPHLLGCLSDGDRIGRELNILQSGVYNGGFIGVSERPAARSFLSWLEDRLHTHCRHVVPEGMLYDQRWIDLAPACFDDVCVVRDVGCNVAHWNLPERDIRTVADSVLVGGVPCRFFHFSGFDPEEPATVTRHSSRLTMDTIGPVSMVFQRYVHLLQRQGSHTCRNWPYAYGYFDNGVEIPDLARLMYQDLSSAASAFGDPFAASGNHSYFRWLNEPADRSIGSRTITRLWDAVYRSRADLQQAFPDPCGGDHCAFLDWVVTSGVREHAIAEAFVPPGPHDSWTADSLLL